MGVGLVTSSHTAVVWLVSSMHMHVLFTVAGVGESSVASFDFAFKRFFTCVNSFVNLQILRSCKNLPTTGKGAGEWFFTGMNSQMVNKLVLCFEWLLLPRAFLPVAGVVSYLRSSDMIDGQVGDNIMHGTEHFSAAFSSFFVDPLAGHLLFDGLPHVAKERRAHPIHV